VSSPDDNHDDKYVHAGRYWPWVLLRALPAIVVAVVITFSQDHSARLGFLMFGVLALAGGVTVLLGARRALRPGVARWCFVVQGSLGIVLGAIALFSGSAGLPFLVFLVGAFAVLTGFLELYSGLRARGRSDSARDWLFAGALTVALGIVALVVPADYNQLFTGPDGVERALTASIILVGVLGAYAAILGVYLVIAGLSLKWAPRAVAATAAESGSHSG
jgi:uncharacterized membrane protein HdeD (DUF308 family)